jgi:hypothetical protein
VNVWVVVRVADYSEHVGRCAGRRKCNSTATSGGCLLACDARVMLWVGAGQPGLVVERPNSLTPWLGMVVHAHGLYVCELALLWTCTAIASGPECRQTLFGAGLRLAG